MNSKSLINPNYDLIQYKKISEKYENNSLTYLEQYYTKYFLIDSNENTTEDLYIYQAPNKLLFFKNILRLSPTHPLLQSSQKVKSIKFDEKISQSINKKKQIPLEIKREICVITTEDDKKYSIKAGVVGWVIDFNMRLVKEYDLLQQKPFTEGYIAIIKPKQDDPRKALNHCIVEKKYKDIRTLD
ncbi:8739_t:CDS:2 [Funneliformis geosporum]|uniref:4629_t:CDS:1 n=1 Tax=Funneliformis geosporum TaxID=1117311 RepID=A0A9W4X0M2_9GLOM|nr:8739_t:CDS:2 [Funneliformis geosporum]CAI2177632.1 4629_t:CDS:2 [Funneliformis geosporum]